MDDKANPHGKCYRARGSSYPIIPELIMNKIVSAVKTFIADENGVTAIEYGLIAAVMGAAAVIGATSVGSALKTLFSGIATKLGAVY